MAESAESIEWGALIVLPSGANDVEIRGQRAAAVMAVENTNRALGLADAAKLVYRTVKVGPWTPDAIGDEWGTQYTWPDGYTEVKPASSRTYAEAQVRTCQSAATAVLVCRSVEYGDWWLAAP
jgi:hypothetical protein